MFHAKANSVSCHPVLKNGLKGLQLIQNDAASVLIY